MLLINKDNPIYDLQDFNGMSKQKQIFSSPNNFTNMIKKEAPFNSTTPRFEILKSKNPVGSYLK